MKKSMRGFGFYIFSILLILFLATFLSDWLQGNEDRYGLKDYYTDLEAGLIEGISVYPNEETPTGEVRAVLQDGSVKVFQVTDVTKAEEAALEKGLEVYVHEVTKPNWF